MSERPMTVKEAAVYLQVNQDTIRRYMREGFLEYHKLGALKKKSRYDTRPVRFWKHDLIEFANRSSGIEGAGDD